MRIPSEGEEFAKLIEHIRLAQESAAMLAHLTKDNSPSLSRGWLALSERLKQAQHQITQLAMRKMQ